MKLVGLLPVRNEDWVLGLSARVALQWCDEVVFYLHACTDRSLEILDEIDKARAGNLYLIRGAAGDWDEMRHRQEMLIVARELKATHIAMIDADEVLTANLVGTIRGMIESLSPGQMLELPGYNLRGSLDRYHSNGIWGQRWFSCAFKDEPEAHWAGDKFHSRNPSGVKWQTWRPIKQGEGGILHLWGASERRLRAKHALYKVTERLRWPAKSTGEINRMYNLWRSKDDELISYPKQWPNEWEYAQTPDTWWRHDVAYVSFDSEIPWQEAEVRRLVQERGKETFQGLDLFGVV
jgi:Glycosyl transferase family 2